MGFLKKYNKKLKNRIILIFQDLSEILNSVELDKLSEGLVTYKETTVNHDFLWWSALRRIHFKK